MRDRLLAGVVLVLAGMTLAVAPAAEAATYTVNTNADPVGAGCAGGTCSLRQAVAAVNAGAGTGDTIVIPAMHITLSAGSQIVIAKPVRITGAGARDSIIDANSTSRIFRVDAGAPTTIEFLTLTRGTIGGGGAAIGNNDALTLRQVAVVDNHATSNTAGAIANNSTGVLTIEGSTFSGNTAGTIGGALYLSGPATITNSTFSGNSANTSATTWDGGAIYVNAATTITNSTITGNTAYGGGGVYIGGDSATFKNTIVAANTATGVGQPVNCINTGTITSQGGNLEDTDTCSFGQATDKPNTEPQLGALQDNGGPTDTHALQAGSQAIDAGVSEGCPSTDQRGAIRPGLGGCDIGAYERGPVATTGPATAIAQTAATVSGTVGPNLRATTYHFEYGATATYGTVTPDQDVGAGADPVAASAALTGLTPGTTYHYRLVVTNAEGTALGADQTFTTPVVDPPPPSPGPTTADTTPPLLTLLSLTPVKFRAARSGGSIARTKKGATIRYRLSEAAITTFRIHRVLRGVRVRGKCVKPTRTNRSNNRCRRFVALRGSFRHSGKTGANRFRFTGRLRRKALAPGSYRLSATPRDAAGNSGRRVRKLFRIVR